MSGPRPTPTYLKLLRSNPGKRKLNKNEPKPEIPAKLPAPPAFLDDYAIEEWKRVAPELWRMGLLSHVDVAALAGYCFAYSQWKTAAETLSRMGVNDPVMRGQLVKAQGGPVVNPLVWVARSALRDMIRLCQEFGMTPAARVGIATGVDPRGPSKFGDLLA